MKLSSYSTSRSHIDKCLANSKALHIPKVSTSNQSLRISNKSGGPQIIAHIPNRKAFPRFFLWETNSIIINSFQAYNSEPLLCCIAWVFLFQPKFSTPNPVIEDAHYQILHKLISELTETLLVGHVKNPLTKVINSNNWSEYIDYTNYLFNIRIS